ncbi:MAG: histidine kinase [Ginsengibacter sp.]
MKKEVIILGISLITIFKVSFGQINEPNKSHGRYAFHNTILAINNSFIVNPERKFAGETIKFPFKTEKLLITGADLKISITEINNQDSMDSSGWLSYYIQDTVAADSNLFKLKNLQLKVKENNKIINDWNDVINYPSFLDSSIALKSNPNGYKKSFQVFNDSLRVNDSVEIEFRNKNNLELLSKYFLKRIGLPVTPFLAMMWQDSSKTESASAFIQTAIAKKDRELKSINSFYADWPANIGESHNNERYFPSSKLAFYFRKPNANFPDSSLEYQLSGGENRDTSWHKSGHLVIIPKLESNSNYILSVRYIDYPENIWKKTFYVPPNWYQTNTFYVIVGFTVALILMFFLFLLYRQKLKKEKDRKAKLNLELRSIRSQLNPHFVFNALGSIQGLINTNEIDKANQYLSEFSNLLRDSLKSSDKDFVPLASEIKMIKSYLKLEQLRFGFEFKINLDDKINTSEIQIPSLLLQPLIENAVKHGIPEMRENGEISIDFYGKGKTMYIQIKDNGKGFDSLQKNAGYGLKLTLERIHLLNQSHKEKFIEMTIKSEKEKGSDLLLSFKNYLEK